MTTHKKTAKKTIKKPTKFASAERTNKRQLEAEHKKVLSHILTDPVAIKILDSVMEIVMVLDKNRQVVFTNKALHELLGIKNGEALRGLRPGEMFGCVNADETTGGCGTSEHCSKCGAVLSILSALGGEPRSEECTVVQRDTDTAIDLAVSAIPFDVESERYSLFMIVDISDKKRREAMERLFFHDILNTSGVLSGLSEILKMDKGDKIPNLGERIFKATVRLIDEIQTQRSLSLAEKGELVPQITHIYANDVVKDTVEAYANHQVANGKKLVVDASSEDVELDSDPVLLSRVVGNLIKNALEASEKGDEVKVGCHKKNGSAEFWVHNDAVMSKDVQLQMFKRSFTTKGIGRGLGTYSVKLLSERYLKGEVGFESSGGKGTTFFARYPA